MNSKIKNLTERQLARMLEVRDQWIAHGLSCDPADETRAESGIIESYRNAGLSTPYIVWCASPLSGALTIKAMGQMNKKRVTSRYRRISVQDYVWDTVLKCARSDEEESVIGHAVQSVILSFASLEKIEDAIQSKGYRVWDKGIGGVEDGVKDRVCDSVWEGVRNIVGESVNERVWGAMGEKVHERVSGRVLDSLNNGAKRRLKRMVMEFPIDGVWEDGVWDNIRDRWRGIINDETGSVFPAQNTQREWGVLAIYDYFNTVLGLHNETRKIKGLLSIAQSSGWFWPHERICWICDRPAAIHMDTDNRLHRTNGPAISFRDGWKIYAHHGVTLPSWIVEEPEKITPAKINEERNAEIRRVMIEKFGEERYLLERHSKLIGSDAFGRLWKQEIGNIEPVVMVQLLNSTPEHDGSMSVKEAIAVFGEDAQVNHDGMMMRLGAVPDALRFKSYLLRVPPTCKTPKEAVAWTFDKTENDYDIVAQS